MKCNTQSKKFGKARNDEKLVFFNKTKNENAIQTHNTRKVNASLNKNNNLLF